MIRVSDTGVGLPAEMLSRVFDLFAQADRSLDRSEGGLGIGLTVARRLAEMHGGSVTAASAGLGRGSQFTVRLPLARRRGGDRGAGRRAAAEAALRGAAAGVGGRRQPRHGPIGRAAVGAHGARGVRGVRRAGSAGAAREFQPEVLLLDIGLPGMTGYELVKRLREEGFEQATIVAVSGYGQPTDKERSREAGFDDHLVKPVDREALSTAVERVRAGVDVGGRAFQAAGRPIAFAQSTRASL